MTPRTRARPARMSPSPNRSPISPHWCDRLAAEDATIRGIVSTVTSTVRIISGTTSSTHSVTTARAHHFSCRRLGRTPPRRQHARQRRADAVEQVGDAGEVREDVVAVEADERRQLPHHLDELGGDDQQQGVPPAQPPGHEHGHRQQRVEVQPAEVGTQPSAAPEPVAVGHVGVEGGPDQVQPGAHRTGRGAAVARAGRVTELVEPGRQHGDREDREQHARRRERLVRGEGEPLLEQHPLAHQHERDQCRDDDQRLEQPRERPGDATRHLRVGDDEPESQCQQRIGLPDLGLRTVRAAQRARAGAASCRSASGRRPLSASARRWR